MKVAVIIDTWFPLVGGGQINAWEVSRRLAKKGALVDIVTRDNGIDNLPKVKNLQIYKLGPKSKPSDTFSKIIFTLRAVIFIVKRDYDIVHVHAFLPGFSAKLLLIFKRLPVIFTVHGTTLGTTLNNSLFQWVEKFILTQIRYTAQITVSRDFLTLKNVNKNIAYIPNGVDINLFDKVKTEKFSDPTLIFVGRLHPQKNLKTLILAIEIVRKTIPNINLLIIGEGSLMNGLLDLIKEKKLQKNIKLLGRKKGRDLIRLYKSSHIFILPSIYEGQPLTLFEAWAAKLPVIVTKSGDCTFLIKDKHNGFLISNTQSVKEIANSILKAFENKNLSKIGQNGYDFTKRNFSWEKSANETLKVYRKTMHE